MGDRPTTAELVAAERAAQGLPRRVEDPAVLERIATLLQPRRPGALTEDRTGEP